MNYVNHPVDLSRIRLNCANFALYNLYRVFRTVFNFKISSSFGSKSTPVPSIRSLMFSVMSSSVISSLSELRSSIPTSTATSPPII